MARQTPDTTPRPQADRLKAFELYLSSSLEGKYRSLRSIANELGISAMTVGRWREVDRWDSRIKTELAASTTAAESTSNALKRRVRHALLEGLSELQRLALEAARDSDRIKAIEAMASMALKMDALTAAATAGQGAQAVHDFSDDLPEDNKWQSLPDTESGEQPEPPPVESESSSETPELKPEEPESLSPSSEAASESSREASAQ